ncbi:MAG: SAM-dependent methyltransferase [Candidatus Methanoperedenaceae archaeon]|nr:SAM-dependent methyltransferase [Candidatus Methanoperedenaceae archaeon]
MALSEIIIDKIRQKGMLSFRDFMDMALYYPVLGYYTSKKDKIGKKGDFYTSSNVSSVFGEMIGKQVEEIWHLLGEGEFTVVEMGAGHGLLSGDVLSYLETNHELYGCLDYRIVEKSPALREEQEKRLGGKAKWFESINELSGIKGVIFSNELVDAFPVHCVVMEDELMEVFVDYDNGFVEVLKPASYELRDYFKRQDVVLPEGYRTEVNHDTLKWIHDAGSALELGYVITIDYGYPAPELYAGHRNNGTLMCYYRHTANDNPYLHIGEQDITSHVNFSAIDIWGRESGLELCGFTDQAHFLLGMGIEKYLAGIQNSEPGKYMKKMLQVKTLMMGMGETFKVMVQGKGVKRCVLSCFKVPSQWKL